MPDLSLEAFLTDRPVVLVELAEAKGSTPREAGAFMLVSADAIWGTIGGGQFEYMAMDNARALLLGGGVAVMDIPLGPEIGQCCGGRTVLAFTRVTPEIAASLFGRIDSQRENRPEVMLFGAGHVGLALARALAPLPFATSVIETRREALEHLPPTLPHTLTAMPESCVEHIAPGGAVVILTHDHALDFLIAERALARTDLAYVGMIGSATKRATFSSWLVRQLGADMPRGRIDDMLSSLVLPIGGSAVRDKRPEVIAALVAAELVTRLLQLSPETNRKRQPTDG